MLRVAAFFTIMLFALPASAARLSVQVFSCSQVWGGTIWIVRRVRISMAISLVLALSRGSSAGTSHMHQRGAIFTFNLANRFPPFGFAYTVERHATNKVMT